MMSALEFLRTREWANNDEIVFEDMEAYAAYRTKEVLERAAQECEKEYMTGTTGTAAMAAMRVRALKDKP